MELIDIGANLAHDSFDRDRDEVLLGDRPVGHDAPDIGVGHRQAEVA